MLQVGGVQEAMMAAPPGVAADPLAVAVLPLVVLLLLPVTLIAAGFEELHVRGTPVMVVPRLSTTAAVMDFEVAVPAATVSIMDCTGQVVKVTGTLFVLLTLAKIEVTPGTLAVTCACPGSSPLAVVLTPTTLALNDCQLNGPTVAVMSTPRLKAVAW
jgi:hypothetical protein